MADLNRRSVTLLALLAPLAAAGKRAAGDPASPAPPPDHDMSSMPASWTRPDQIAMLVYPKMTALDLIGPQYMFASLMGATVHLVGKTLAPVTSDTGVTIVPTVTFDECPRDLTVLFTPGGTNGTLAAMQDPATLEFMADRGSRARYVTSVCTGSLILGAAGLLRGYKATSHWSTRDVLSAFGAIPTDARVVRDRNRITGAASRRDWILGCKWSLSYGMPATPRMSSSCASTIPSHRFFRDRYTRHPPRFSPRCVGCSPASWLGHAIWQGKESPDDGRARMRVNP